MPHLIVKFHEGRSEELKAALAARLTRAVMDVERCPESAVSVGIEDVESAA